MGTWDATFNTKPAGSRSPAQGDDDIREFKTEVQGRMDHETVWLDSTLITGGVNRAGSAKAYYQSGAPTLKPNSADGALAAGDAGRLWVDSDDMSINVWDGSAMARTGKTIQVLAADPASPIAGEIWIRSDLV